MYILLYISVPIIMYNLFQSFTNNNKPNNNYNNNYTNNSNLLESLCPNCNNLFFIEPYIENNSIKIRIKKNQNLLINVSTNISTKNYNNQNLILEICPHCNEPLYFDTIIKKGSEIYIEPKINNEQKKYYNNIDKKEKIQESKRVSLENSYKDELSIPRKISTEIILEENNTNNKISLNNKTKSKMEIQIDKNKFTINKYKDKYDKNLLLSENNIRDIILFVKKDDLNNIINYNSKYYFGIEIFNYAIENYDCNILEKLKKYNFPWDESSVVKTIKIECDKKLEFVIKNKCPIIDSEKIYDQAFKNDILIKILLDNKILIPENIIKLAIEKKSTYINYFIEQKYKLTSECFGAALINNDIETLKILKDNNCPIDNIDDFSLGMISKYTNLKIWFEENYPIFLDKYKKNF